MAVYVRVRDLAALRDQINRTRTTQADLARAAHTSPARISHIVTGRARTVALTVAAAIEDTLTVPRGSLFEITDPADLVSPYMSPIPGAA